MFELYNSHSFEAEINYYPEMHEGIGGEIDELKRA